MNKGRFIYQILAVAVFTLALSSVAQAQATRTWVSGVGDDVNPCSRTAPCKTFAGAISKTAAGGEIDALDPGGYGALTITKAITVDGGTGAGWASTLASGTNGFIVNAGVNDVVHLRNLSINGAGTTLGIDGIRFLAGHTLHVENVNIFRFSGDGIEVAFSGANVGRLNVRNVRISECGTTGILVAGTNTVQHAITIDDANIVRCGHGFRLNNRAIVTISNSVISTNNQNPTSAGVIVDSATAGQIVNLESCQVNFNSIGVQSNTGHAIRLSNIYMTANGNALNFAGGTIASFQNNRIAGNAAGENFAALTDILQQ